MVDEPVEISNLPRFSTYNPTPTVWVWAETRGTMRKSSISGKINLFIKPNWKAVIYKFYCSAKIYCLSKHQVKIWEKKQFISNPNKTTKTL